MDLLWNLFPRHHSLGQGICSMQWAVRVSLPPAGFNSMTAELFTSGGANQRGLL